MDGLFRKDFVSFPLVQTVKGSYCIAAFLPEDADIEIAKLGTFSFRRGMYVYTGSALSSLEGRIGRHIGKEKKMKWHIDFFLEMAEVLGFISIVSSKREECSINSKFLEEGEVLAKGFGSSDCRCPSHLVYLGDQPHLE
ncbi:MAG: GIY-YIG nuclease family protein [Thermoplasmata archaeon]